MTPDFREYLKCWRCNSLMRRIPLIIGWGWKCDKCRAWRPA
jgi:hypothetical protein